MAEFRVQVVIDPAGATSGGRRVRRELQQVERSAQRVGNAIRSALAFAGITVGIGQLVQLADTFTNLQNRVRTVTDTQAELVAVQRELLDISNATRSSLESTTELFVRVGLATRELGISQRETLQFTESLNQAVILSGASAQEAEAGLIQLSQGLASGALRGDELRSVLEQLPAVADVIAQGLGVTRGELRELGAEGAITAEVVIDAFREAEESLRTGFAETVPTIGQAFTVLRNNLITLVGGFAESSGASEAFARAILLLSENLETLLRILGAVAIALGARGLVAGLVLARNAVIGLTAAIAANPLGAIVVALTAAVSLLITFADQIGITSNSLATLSDVWTALFEIITSGLDIAVAALQGFADLISSAFGGATAEIDLSFQGIVTGAARVIDAVIGLFVGGAAAIVEAFRQIPAALEQIFVQAFNFINRRFASFINDIIGDLNLLPGVAIEPIQEFQLEAESTFSELGANINTAFADGFQASTAATDAVSGFFDRVDEIAAARVADSAIMDLAAGQGFDLDAAGPRTAPTAAGGGAGGGTRAVREQNEELERLADLLNEVRGLDEDLLQRQADLNFLFQSGQISIEQFTAAMRDLNVELSALDNSFTGGIANGFDRIIQRSNELGSQISDFVVGAFDQATEAIVNFAQTGEFNVREFFGTLSAQLLQIATNQLFSQLLGGLTGPGGGASLFGGGGGGLLSGLGGLLGFQNGGSFMVGGAGGTDSQLVAFRATPNERVTVETPGQARQGDAAAPTIVQAPAPNVEVRITPRDITDALSGREGDDLIVQGIERNARSVQAVLQGG